MYEDGGEKVDSKALCYTTTWSKCNVDVCRWASLVWVMWYLVYLYSRYLASNGLKNSLKQSESVLSEKWNHYVRIQLYIAKGISSDEFGYLGRPGVKRINLIWTDS